MIGADDIVIRDLGGGVPKERIRVRRRVDGDHDVEVARVVVSDVDVDGRVLVAGQVAGRGVARGAQRRGLRGLDVVVDLAEDLGGVVVVEEGEGVGADVDGVVADADEVVERPGCFVQGGGGCGCGGGEAGEGQEVGEVHGDAVKEANVQIEGE